MSETRITDEDYADVALYDKVNAIANEIDAETVHLTGKETITGAKVYDNPNWLQKGDNNPTYIFQNKKIDQVNEPDENVNHYLGDIAFRDSTSRQIVANQVLSYNYNDKSLTRWFVDVRRWIDASTQTYGQLRIETTPTTYTVSFVGNGTNAINLPLSQNVTGTADTTVALKGWCNNPSLNNMVHKTGNETIAGNKVINSDYTVIKSVNIDETVTPSSTQFCTIQWHDKNDKEIGSVYSAKHPDGYNYVDLHSTAHTADGKSHLAYISLFANPTTGGVSAKTINPAGTSNTNEIATTKWVNDKINTQLNNLGTNYVTTNTAQTITSQKTFESNIISAKQHFIDIRDDRIDALTNPASNIGTSNYRFSDKNGKQLGFMYLQQTTLGENRVNIECRNYMGTPNDNSDYNHCAFSTFNNGKVSYVAFGASSKITNNSLSHADSSTTQTIIPTMGWVNNPATSTNVVHRSGNETINGTKTFTGNITHNNSVKMNNTKQLQFLASDNSTVVANLNVDSGGNFMITSSGGTKNLGYSNFANFFLNGATSLCFNNTGSKTIAKINQGTTGTLYISNTQDVDATGNSAFKVPTPSNSPNVKEAVNVEYANSHLVTNKGGITGIYVVKTEEEAQSYSAANPNVLVISTD